MINIPQLMTGIHLTGHGGFDKLLLRRDIPVPKPGSHDVLIKVSAAGVNNTDINTRTAWYSQSNDNSSDDGWFGGAIQFPRIQGADVCGHVVAIGECVEEELLNERVIIEPCIWEFGGLPLQSPWYLGSECDGGFAEYTVVAAKHAYKIHSSYSDVELASFPCSYSTAENLLTRTSAGRKDTILISGASGGVGSAAVQLAKARGAKIIAITSPSKSAEVEKLGAMQTIDRNANIVQALGKNSVDIVIDLVAGKQWSQFLEVLKPFGKYATSGAIAGAMVNLDARTLYLKDLSLFGCTVLDKDVFGNIIKRIEAEEIKALVSDTFALSQIVEAQKQFERKQHVGKLVIDLSIKK